MYNGECRQYAVHGLRGATDHIRRCDNAIALYDKYIKEASMSVNRAVKKSYGAFLQSKVDKIVEAETEKQS